MTALEKQVISIHKALTGLDTSDATTDETYNHFNPQGPHGPRRMSLPIRGGDNLFQSTRPSRASTFAIEFIFIDFDISIHKALTGLDRSLMNF